MSEDSIKPCQVGSQSGQILWLVLTGQTTREFFAWLQYQKTLYYFVTERNKQVLYPFPLDDKWKESVCEVAKTILHIPATRSRPGNEAGLDDDIQQTQDSPSKRQHTEEPQEAKQISYWPDSPEAYQLFRPRQGVTSAGQEMTYDCSESPQEAVEHRVQRLQSVNKSEDGWRNVIVGRDEDNFCTKAEIFQIRQRAAFLCRAYQLALSNMNKWTWYKCCQKTCDELNALGMTQATCSKTIAIWNKTYRQFEGFPHPNPYVRCGKRPLPRLLEVFPDANKAQIISFAVKNLAKLTIEAVHDFILSNVIPRLIKTWKQEDIAVSTGAPSQNDTASIEEDMNNGTCNAMCSFLKAHGLHSFSLSTAYKWMTLLGFRHDSRKKSFYVDGHEREDVIQDRIVFCKEYLTQFEPFCCRWVQVSKEKAASIKGVDIVGFGFHFHDIIAGFDCVEFHIDYWIV